MHIFVGCGAKEKIFGGVGQKHFVRKCDEPSSFIRDCDIRCVLVACLELTEESIDKGVMVSEANFSYQKFVLSSSHRRPGFDFRRGGILPTESQTVFYMVFHFLTITERCYGVLKYRSTLAIRFCRFDGF